MSIERFLLIDSQFKNSYQMTKSESKPTTLTMLPKLDNNDPPVGFVKPIGDSDPFVPGFYWIFARGNKWASEIVVNNVRAKDSNIIESVDFRWSTDVDHAIFNTTFLGYNYILPIGEYEQTTDLSEDLAPLIVDSVLVVIQDRRSELNKEVRSQVREYISVNNAIKLHDIIMNWLREINVSLIGFWTWIPTELAKSEGSNALDMIIGFRDVDDDELIDKFLHMVSMISRNIALAPDLTLFEQLLSNDNNWDAGTGTSLYLNSDKPMITMNPKDLFSNEKFDKFLASLFTFAVIFPRKRDETVDDYESWINGLSLIAPQLKWVKLNLAVIKYLRFDKIYAFEIEDKTYEGSASELVSNAATNAEVLSIARKIVSFWPFVLNDLIRSD